MKRSHSYLRPLPAMARLGVGALIVVILGGLVASAKTMWDHYQNRDERPGLTMTDIEGAYHGVTAKSALIASLERGHHETTPEPARAALLSWLNGDKVAENYDNLDLGDNAPNEVIAANCLSCHSKRDGTKLSQSGGIALDTWDDVRKVAFSTRIEPTNLKVMTASAHAHTLSLSTLTLVLAAVLWMTRFGSGIKGLAIGAMGVSLLIDLGSWWLAREWASAVKLIVLGGAIYNAFVALSSLMVLADLALPLHTPKEHKTP